MTTDTEAEAFLDQDRSTLDFTQFRPLTWETAAKDARINRRNPTNLLNPKQPRH